MRLLAVALAWLLVAGIIGVASAQSVQTQQPTESKQQRNPASQNQPLYSIFISQPQTGNRATQKDEGSSETAQTIQAIAAAVSAFFAGLIYFIYDQQRVIMSGQLKAAVDAAEAAKDSAQAAIMQARLAIIPHRARMAPGFPTPIKPGAAAWNVEIDVKNIGRAVGRLGDTYVTFTDELADVPDYTKMLKAGDGTILGPGEAKHVSTFPSPSTKEGQFCYGYILYGDEIGDWRRRFCVQIWTAPKPGVNFFHEAGGRAYGGEDYVED